MRKWSFVAPSNKILNDPSNYILDVRGPAERLTTIGFPPRSHCFELGKLINSPDPSLPGNDKGKAVKIFVHCRSGFRAQKAAQHLSDCGYDYVKVIEGGQLGWRAANLPFIEIDNNLSENAHALKTLLPLDVRDAIWQCWVDTNRYHLEKAGKHFDLEASSAMVKKAFDTAGGGWDSPEKKLFPDVIAKLGQLGVGQGHSMEDITLHTKEYMSLVTPWSLS